MLNVTVSCQFGRPFPLLSMTMTGPVIELEPPLLVWWPLPANAAGTSPSESTSTTPASTAPTGVGFLIFIPNLPVRARPQWHPYWMTNQAFDTCSAALFTRARDSAARAPNALRGFFDPGFL